MTTTSSIRVGDAAPDFEIATGHGRSVTLDSFAREPLVIAFFAGPSFPAQVAPAELERARAELRALGAALLAIFGRDLWSFRADDETQLLTTADDEAPIARLRDKLGVSAGASGVFVLDAAACIRFSRVGPAGGTTFAAVVDALEVAGRDLVASETRLEMTRRQVLVGSLVAAFGAAFLDGCRAPLPVFAAGAPSVEDGEVDLKLDVNGVSRALRVDARVTLLDALRERLGLWGTKKGCDQGQCGACTVLVDGRRVNACLTLALAAEGLPIVSIEGLAHEETLHPLQQAFIEEDGFQCGYCTSGQIMSACGMLAERHAAAIAASELDDDAIREGMSGNLCRCGAYPNIVAAIRRAARQGVVGT